MRALSNKTVEATAEAIKSVLLEIASEPTHVRKVPRILFTDRGRQIKKYYLFSQPPRKLAGGEFVGAKTGEVLNAHGIRHWVAQGGPKAALAEMKVRQFKHLTYK